MKIDLTDNGQNSVISYANKLFFRKSPNDAFVQFRNVYFRHSPDDEYTRCYQFDDKAPIITITSSSEETIYANYTLKGRIIDSISGVSFVSINGVKINLDDNGYFSKNYTLTNGNNSFMIIAEDVAGNVSSKTVTISKRDPQPHAVSVASVITGDNGNTQAAHSKWFLEQGESKMIYSSVSWSGWLIVDNLPKGTVKVVVNKLGNAGGGSATITNLSGNVRLSDADNESMWCNETGRLYEVKAVAGISSVYAYY